MKRKRAQHGQQIVFQLGHWGKLGARLGRSAKVVVARVISGNEDLQKP